MRHSNQSHRSRMFCGPGSTLPALPARTPLLSRILIGPLACQDNVVSHITGDDRNMGVGSKTAIRTLEVLDKTAGIRCLVSGILVLITAASDDAVNIYAYARRGSGGAHGLMMEASVSNAQPKTTSSLGGLQVSRRNSGQLATPAFRPPTVCASRHLAMECLKNLPKKRSKRVGVYLETRDGYRGATRTRDRAMMRVASSNERDSAASLHEADYQLVYRESHCFSPAPVLH